MNQRLLVSGLMICWCVQGVDAQIFESDFLGSSHEIYDDHEFRDLVEGWRGQAAGGGGGSAWPYSNIGFGIMTYRGGTGNSADRVDIGHQLIGIPADWLLQIRFRRDGAHEPERNDMSLRINAMQYIASGEGQSQPFGTVETNTPYPLTTGTWYIMEVIEKRVPEPSWIRITGNNYVASQMSVDWVFIDEAPATDNTLEMRIWEDGTGRPDDPTVFVCGHPTADLTGDGVVDTLDLLLFLNLWVSGDSLADWNEDGTIDNQDFVAYLNDWAEGGC